MKGQSDDNHSRVGDADGFSHRRQRDKSGQSFHHFCNREQEFKRAFTVFIVTRESQVRFKQA
jgi:hypothetical protein